MPAIIMHAGAGVLLIIMTNFASPKQNNKTKSPLSRIHIANINNTRYEGWSCFGGGGGDADVCAKYAVGGRRGARTGENKGL